MRAAARLAALLLALCGVAHAHAPHDPVLAVGVSPGFAEDRTLFVALKGFSLMLRSTDGGETFHTIHRGLHSTFVSSLVLSPDFVRDRTLWVSNGRTVALSRDAGESWTTMDLGFDGLVGVLDLEVAGDALLVASSRGLLRVEDPRSPRPRRVRLTPRPQGLARLAVAPAPGSGAEGAPVIAALDARRAFVSFDGGESLLLMELPGALRPTAVLVTHDAADEARLWVGTADGRVLMARADQPRWHPVGEPLPGGAVLSLAAPRDARGNLRVLASTSSGGVHELRAGSWRTHDEGLRELSGQSSEHHLEVVPSPAFAEDNTLFLATFEGLHRKVGGAPWEWLTTLPRVLARDVALSPEFADDERLLVAGYGDGLLQSDDGGRSFRAHRSGPWVWPDGVAVSPDGSMLIQGGPNRQLVTLDGGARWHELFRREGGFLDRVEFAPDFAETGEIFMQLLIYTEVAHNQFLVSRDRGVSWEQKGPREVTDFELAPDFSTSGRLWLATHEGLLRSDDRGASFTPVPAPFDNVRALAAVPHAGSTLLAVASASGALAVSRDGGASWEHPELADPVGLLDGAVDAEGRVTLVAGGQTVGVLVSRDAGRTWTVPETAPDCVFALDICRDFAREPALLAAAYDGAWLSRDGGASWRRLDIDARVAEEQPATRGAER